MIHDIAKIIASKIKPCMPPTTKAPIGFGRYQNDHKIDILGTKLKFNANHVTTGAMKPMIHIGTIKIGLKATGAPNIKGSLILKILGIIVALPISLFFFDFAMKQNIKARASVQPPPPIVI